MRVTQTKRADSKRSAVQGADTRAIRCPGCTGGVCPGLNPFLSSQRMPTPPSPSMRGNNNSGFEIVSTCGYRADQRLVG